MLRRSSGTRKLQKNNGAVIVSPHGLVIKRIPAPTGLKPHILVMLDISDFIEKSMVEMQIMTIGRGITLDFHYTNEQIYLFETEMGHVHV